jgi:septal ring factor EnvC (AmiA/AmiB activator)
MGASAYTQNTKLQAKPHRDEKTSSAKDSVRSALIEVTQRIILLEQQVEECRLKKTELVSCEKEALSAALVQQHRFGHTLKSIRFLHDASPFLMALTSQSLDDFIKSIVLLQSMAPRLATRNNMVLDRLKTLVKNRKEVKILDAQRISLRQKFHEYITQQEQLLADKYRLFFNGAKNPALEHISQQVSPYLESEPTHFDDVVHQLHTLLTTDQAHSSKELELMTPVSGTLMETPTTEGDLSIVFDTHHGAQVVSPWAATVVFTGFVPAHGQIIILKQDDFFLVMSGLGTVHCFLGDGLLPGEPIGRMAEGHQVMNRKVDHKGGQSDDASRCHLRLELHKGGQHLDPRPYLKPLVLV